MSQQQHLSSATIRQDLVDRHSMKDANARSGSGFQRMLNMKGWPFLCVLLCLTGLAGRAAAAVVLTGEVLDQAGDPGVGAWVTLLPTEVDGERKNLGKTEEAQSPPVVGTRTDSGGEHYTLTISGGNFFALRIRQPKHRAHVQARAQRSLTAPPGAWVRPLGAWRLAAALRAISLLLGSWFRSIQWKCTACTTPRSMTGRSFQARSLPDSPATRQRHRIAK